MHETVLVDIVVTCQKVKCLHIYRIFNIKRKWNKIQKLSNENLLCCEIVFFSIFEEKCFLFGIIILEPTKTTFFKATLKITYTKIKHEQ